MVDYSEIVENFVAGALFSDDGHGRELWVVTSFVRVDGHALPWIRVELFDGDKPYTEDGEGMVLELPALVWALVCRHVQKAMQAAICPDMDGGE